MSIDQGDYTPEEIEGFRAQLRAGNEAARVAAAGRGYELHHRIKAIRAEIVKDVRTLAGRDGTDLGVFEEFLDLWAVGRARDADMPQDCRDLVRRSRGTT